MSVLHQLASSLNHKDQVPNIELAKKIAAKNDKKAVAELVENLDNKKKDIQMDCIKVLYEIGELKPVLIEEYLKKFIALLDHKNNRLQWGAMTAVNLLAAGNPAAVYAALPKIIATADSGSVITRDHAVNILITLAAVKKYADDAFSLLIEQLKTAPTNQLPMYAENAVPVITGKNKIIFIKTLQSRLDDIEKDTKRSRVEKVIKKLR